MWVVNIIVESFRQRIPFVFSFSLNFYILKCIWKLVVDTTFLSFFIDWNWPRFMVLQDQMLTSILQIPNYGQQQCDVLNTQNQDAILTQALTSTPNSQTFTAPQNFSRCNNQYPEIPKTESSNSYRQVCVFVSHQLTFQKTFVLILDFREAVFS